MRSCENCILCKAVKCPTSLYEDYMAKFDDCEYYAETWEEYEKIIEEEERVSPIVMNSETRKCCKCHKDRNEMYHDLSGPIEVSWCVQCWWKYHQCQTKLDKFIEGVKP